MAETIGKYYIMKQQNTSWKLLCFKLMIKNNKTISALSKHLHKRQTKVYMW